jgi:hypothetical protein
MQPTANALFTDANDARTAWISALRAEVLRLVYRTGMSERQYFQNRAEAHWQRHHP